MFGKLLWKNQGPLMGIFEVCLKILHLGIFGNWLVNYFSKTRLENSFENYYGKLFLKIMLTNLLKIIMGIIFENAGGNDLGISRQFFVTHFEILSKPCF